MYSYKPLYLLCSILAREGEQVKEDYLAHSNHKDILIKSKLITLFLVLLCGALIPLFAMADTLDSGTCGDLSWTLSDENILTITGNGILPNNAHPWNDYSSGKDYNNQIVAERFCPAKKVDVTIMKQVKCAICDNSFHSLISSR